ncbi:MAG: DoxX family protein [Actinomycetaceae bacterium]|nr:DoxX family protein [Actinomycetaceae bacterium]
MPVTPSSEMSDGDFDAAWKDITANLSDLDFPGKDTSEIPTGHGPKDRASSSSTLFSGGASGFANAGETTDTGNAKSLSDTGPTHESASFFRSSTRRRGKNAGTASPSNTDAAPADDHGSSAFGGPAHPTGEVDSRPVGGPRDWTPASEDDDEFFSYEDDVLAQIPEADDTPVSPLAVALWVAAGVTLTGAIAILIGLLPGSGGLAGTMIAASFILGAFAAFASSPRDDDIDPFDDGARV